MYQVSDELGEIISGSGRTFAASIGDVQTGFQKISMTSMSTADSYLDIGSAIATKIDVSMYTSSTEFVEGKEFEFKLGATVDDTIEWIPMGVYTIDEASKDRNLLTFTAYDNIGAKLSGTYTSTITTYPAESRQFLTDISTQTGVVFDTSSLTETIDIDRIITIDDQSGEKVYETPFDGFTMQQVVGYIAMLHSRFALCDRSGNIVFKWYADNTYTVNANRYYDDLAKTETQCAITGIICKTEKGQIKSGDDANLTLTNPIMTKEWLDNVLTHVADLAFYPVSFTCMGDPRIDVGDIIKVVDSTGTKIDVPVMLHSLTFDGGLLSEIASYGIAKSETQSPTDVALQRIKDDMLALQEITAQKITVDQLNATNLKIQNVQEMVETSVATVTVEYYKSTSATEMSGGSWSTNQPTWEDGKYIWTRNKTTSNAGAITYSTAVCITGNTGATGAQGDKGATGDNGKSIGLIINYYLATSASSGVTTSTKGWTTSVQNVSETNKYLWNYEVIKYTDGTTASTSVPCIIGTYGDTGSKGDKGDTGATGNGIKSITEHYAVSTSNSTTPTSWSSSVPTLTTTNKYLWNYETITYTSGSTDDTEKRVIGVYGDKGTDGTNGTNGKSIGSITNYYLATSASTGVTTSTSGWTTTVQTISKDKKYLWNYEVIKYSDNTTASTSAPCIIGTFGVDGTNGTNGTDGVGIKSITEHYAVSTSNSTTPTSWSSSVPTLTTTNKYLWNYETITYTSGSTDDTEKRVIGVYGDKGTDGTNGTNGKSIGSITNYYLATSASTGVTTSTSGWTTTVQTISKDKKYLWNYEVIKYSDNTTASTSAPCIIGTFGVDGTNGTNGTDGVGIKSITEHYAASTSNSTVPTSWSSTVPTLTVTNRYLWNYETITYTNSTSKDTSKRVIGVYGATGDKGDKGDKGDTGETGKGVKSIVPQYYLSTSNTTQTGGSWSTSQPTWETGHYIWTRSYITWTDSTTTTTTPILAEALNSANQQGYDNAQDISKLGETVTKQGTSIETVENQIAEKVWTTDITTALEPVQESVSTAQSTADNAVTVTTQNTNEIESLKMSTESITTALSSYTKTTDFEEYKKEVSSQLSQTPEAITARFTTLEETITKQGDESSSKWKTLETYIQFGADGVTLGKTDDPLTLTIDNGKICFMQSGQKVAWFTNNKLYVSNVEATTTAILVGLKIAKNGQHIQIS